MVVSLPYASIFTVELSAILLALHVLYPLEVGRYEIFYDSTAALSAIEDDYIVHPLAIDIFKWLVICRTRGHQVALCLVLAHVSIESNERSHHLAPNCSLLYKYLYISIWSAVQTVWQGRWETLMDTNGQG